jgi:hypothetical protein
MRAEVSGSFRADVAFYTAAHGVTVGISVARLPDRLQLADARLSREFTDEEKRRYADLIEKPTRPPSEAK